MTAPKQVKQQDLQVEPNSESKQNHPLSESQEYSPGADGDIGHLRESLQDYLTQLQLLQGRRFYLSDRAMDPSQFRLTEIGNLG